MIEFSDIKNAFNQMMRTQRGQVLAEARYVARLDCPPDRMFVIDPRQIDIAPINMAQPVVVYHPLCDPPGTYSSRKRQDFPAPPPNP